jgi:NAD(P)-dependent dehydrogenase (short-subunit alcohol dehydrogenase family)
MKLHLAGRTVAITGASGGLGATLAEALRTKGARVALLDLDADRVRELATSLGDARTAQGWAVDVRDFEGLTTVMGEVREHFGRLDIVVAGAGILGPVAALPVTDPQDWDRVIDINLNGVWRTFRAAIPHVSEQRGHLLALSSMIGFMHPPLLGAYAASKAGVWALCDSLRLELRTTGVSVGSVHPTIFRTAMIEGGLSTPAAAELVNDFTGLFEPVELETVVTDILRGLERRSPRVISPRRLTLAQYVPGIFQAIVDRTAFRPSAIRRAVELGSIPPTNPAPTPALSLENR